MSILFWWLPPIVVTLVAMAWLNWRAHRETVNLSKEPSPKELARMAAALSHPMPTSAARNEQTASLRLDIRPDAVEVGQADIEAEAS